jgi:hypothetical protein
MGKNKITREFIIQVLKELDAKSEKTVGRTALVQKGINQYQISNLIPEGLTQLKRKLGLKISRQEDPYSDDELLKKLDKVVSNQKRVPTWIEIRRETGITDKVFVSHFGKEGILGVFRHYRKWLEEHKPKSKHIKLVDAHLENQGKTKTPPSQLVPKKAGAKGMPKWAKVSGRQYGAPLNFGSLIYAPTNEQGVVFLFGMVSKRLGFSIEWVGQEFPDCEAKRYIEGKQKRQQSVKIEFEFLSRQYEKDHPMEGCDIIVCWRDNWNDCPLEVIELRTELKNLRQYQEFAVSKI